MMRRTVALLVCLALPTVARADAVSAVRAELAGIESAPDAARIHRIAGAEEALRTIARDERLAYTTRAKAVAVLGSFPSEATKALLAELATQPAFPVALRIRAPASLARAFGTAALPELRTALADADARVRSATAAALVRQLGQPGVLAVRERRAIEPDAHVQRTLDRLLEAR